MQYFKHSELAAKYHVSLKTVHNWIDAAKNGKAKLALYTAKSGTYIANTTENDPVLREMAENGKKYRNTLHHKVVRPRQEFYEVYSRRQVLDIMNSLDIQHEIPAQYSYMGEGAQNWDGWMKRLATDTSTNFLTGTIEMLRNNAAVIARIVSKAKRVNVIDLGAGNAYPVKELLADLLSYGTLNRYIAIDISQTMLDIAEQNVRGWFGSAVRFEGYVKDMTYERFDDLLIDDMLDEKADSTINIALLLGGTASNFRSYPDVIKLIRESMGRNDILIYADKLDTEASRKYLDFAVKKTDGAGHQTSKLSELDKYLLDLIGIDESLYEVEAGYNPEKLMRYIQIRLNTAITIEFGIDAARQRVQLEKGDVILLLRILHHNSFQIISTFKQAGLAFLHANVSPDHQFYLSISHVESRESEEL